MFGAINSRQWLSTRYSPLQGDDLEIDPKGHVLREVTVASNARLSKTLRALPWILSAVLATFSALLMLKFRNERERAGIGSFSHGYATDFGPARIAIELEQVKFTGGASFREDKTLYIPSPGPIKYTGDPSDEIDQAWEELTDARYILITESEARETWGNEYVDFWDPYRGGYEAGLDMFHTLHCLNNMRKSYYPDVYPSSDSPDVLLHRDHCIEQMRQYIMCSGDMTPIPTRYFKSVDRNYVDSDRFHTCRNFQKLRDWTTERFNGSSAVLPQI